MKKRFETILILLCMMITLMPFTALAVNDGTIYVGGVELTSTADTPAYALTDESGKVTTADAGAENYNIKWDGNILTLSDAKITQESYVFLDSTSAAAIYCKNDLEIYLKGTNTVTSLAGNPENGIHMSSGIYSEGNISISGDGTLEVSGGNVDFIEEENESARAESYGIYSYNGSVTISSGKVTVAGGETISQRDYAHSSGIYSKGLAITGGEIIANNGYSSNWSDDGAASYSYGIYSVGNAIIENAKIYAEGSEATYSAGIFVEGNITIKSGSVQAMGGRSRSATSSGIAAVNGGSVTINGGKVIAAIGLTENGDANAIYADGNITINGGNVIATGPSNDVDGVTPQYSRGIFSETGDITITGTDTVVISISGLAKNERDAIMANAGDIIILGGNVRADGSLNSYYDSLGNGLRALIRKEWPPAPHRSQDKAGSTGGNIIISGGNLAAVGGTKSLNYEGELIVRPKNTEVTVSVLDNWMMKKDPWQLDWEGMAASATQIEGSPFTKETVIDKTLTENKLYFGATSVDVDPIDPGDETIPDDQNNPDNQTGTNSSGGQTDYTDKDNYSPNTGDESNSTLWFALLLVSLISMVVSEHNRRRHRELVKKLCK